MVFMVESDIFYSARMNARSGLGNNKVLKYSLFDLLAFDDTEWVT